MAKPKKKAAPNKRAAAPKVQKPNIAKLHDGSKPLVLSMPARLEDPETAKARKLAELRQTEAEEAEQERIASRVDVDQLSKDQLITHARRSFGIQLNEKENISELRVVVKRLTGRDAVASRNVRAGG